MSFFQGIPPMALLLSMLMFLAYPGVSDAFVPWIPQCMERKVDLILVAEDVGMETYWLDQKIFFENLIREFIALRERRLDRLRISLLVVDNTKKEGAQTIQTQTTTETKVVCDFSATTNYTIHELFSSPYFNYSSFNASSTGSTFDEPALRFAAVNGTSLGAREDAIRVVVMVQMMYWTMATGDLQQVLDLYNNGRDLWLSLVAQDFALDGITGWMPSVDLKSGLGLYKDGHLEDADQRFCTACQPGWFTSENACHLLTPSRDSLNWVESRALCISVHWKGLATDLAKLRTKQQLRDVEKAIHRLLLDEQMNNTSDIKDVSIFIGLRRNLTSLSHNFEWQDFYDKSNKLFFTHWLPGQPVMKRVKNCVLWKFKADLLDPGVMNNLNESEVEKRLSLHSGWHHVDCDRNVPNARALCSNIHFNAVGNIRAFPVRMSPMSLNPLPDVLSRGNFGLWNVTSFGESVVHFISPSSNIDNLRYEMSEMNKFPDDFSVDLQMSNVESPLNAVLDVMPTYSCPIVDRNETHHMPYSHVCDHHLDCSGRQDEKHYCGGIVDAKGYRKCLTADGESQCPRTQQCVQGVDFCDLHVDCPEGLDEMACNCRYYMCGDGQCIPNIYGRNDCVDMKKNRQEMACVTMCNRSSCVTEDLIYNNVTDCRGPEGPVDAVLAKLEAFRCPSNPDPYESTWAPKCVYIKDRFGEMIGCRSLEHLDECDFYACPEGYAKCPNAFCIPVAYVKNGVEECPMGEDETKEVGEFKDSEESNGLFLCTRIKTSWLHPDQVCDGVRQCPGGEDEDECHVSCSQGFLCLGGALVVNGYNKDKVLEDISFIDHRVKFIDLSNVNVPDFFVNYPSGKLLNILDLHLGNCGIKTLEKPASFSNTNYEDFATLTNLTLSKNEITFIGSDSMLTVMRHLYLLNISHNTNLKEIAGDAFSSQASLERLDLSWTGITFLERKIFVSMESLIYLNLRGTQIMTLSFEFPTDLMTLDLRDMEITDVDKTVFKDLTEMKNMMTSSYKLCCEQIRGTDIEDYACHGPEDMMSSCSDLIRQPVMRVLLWVVGILSLVGNAIVVVYRLVWNREHLRKGYGLFVLNLSMSDLLMGVYLIQIASTDIKYKDEFVLHAEDWVHSTACKVAGFLSTLSSETSAFFIFLITVDRFLVIRFPLGQYRINQISAHVCSVAAWIIGIVLAVIPLLPPLDHWAVYNTNAMCLGLPLSVQRAAGWQYSQAIFVGLNFLLFLSIAIGQYLIYRSISKSRMAMSGKISDVRRNQEMAVAKHLSLVAITDFLCWFPIGIMGLMTLAEHDIGQDAYAWTLVLILPINSALNPILYTLPLLKRKWAEFLHKRSKANDSNMTQDASMSVTMTETSMTNGQGQGNRGQGQGVIKILATINGRCRELNGLLESQSRSSAVLNDPNESAMEEFERLSQHVNRLRQAYFTKPEPTPTPTPDVNSSRL